MWAISTFHSELDSGIFKYILFIIGVTSELDSGIVIYIINLGVAGISTVSGVVELFYTYYLSRGSGYIHSERDSGIGGITIPHPKSRGGDIIGKQYHNTCFSTACL